MTEHKWLQKMRQCFLHISIIAKIGVRNQINDGSSMTSIFWSGGKLSTNHKQLTKDIGASQHKMASCQDKWVVGQDERILDKSATQQ
jgi:hypothetical protein